MKQWYLVLHQVKKRLEPLLLLLLCGRSNRPCYGFCPSVRLSALCPFVSYGLLTREEKP